MTEYYTMKECFDKCDDNDMPFVEGLHNCDSMRTKRYLMQCQVRTEAALSDQWQIKKAEPVVYDVENFIKKYETTETLRSFVRLADQNGQLREWLRPEQMKLREAVEVILNQLNHGSNSVTGVAKVGFEKAFKNLKPPYKNQ